MLQGVKNAPVKITPEVFKKKSILKTVLVF